MELLGPLSATGSHCWKEQVRVWTESVDLQPSKPVRSEQSPEQGPSPILWSWPDFSPWRLQKSPGGMLPAPNLPGHRTVAQCLLSICYIQALFKEWSHPISSLRGMKKKVHIILLSHWFQADYFTCIFCFLMRACEVTSIVSNSLWLRGLEPTRLLCPWGLPRWEHWSGLPCPPPGHLPDPGIEPTSLMSPALVGGFLNTGATWEAHPWHKHHLCTTDLLTGLSRTVFHVTTELSSQRSHWLS